MVGIMVEERELQYWTVKGRTARIAKNEQKVSCRKARMGVERDQMQRWCLMYLRVQ